MMVGLETLTHKRTLVTGGAIGTVAAAVGGEWHRVGLGVMLGMIHHLEWWLERFRLD